jgi:hypothetical protein
MGQKVVLPQTSFTGGELSPRVLGRTDLDRYLTGLKRCRNAHPVLHGGFKRRAGFRYIQAAVSATANASILVPFVQGRDLAWMLEFGNNTIRVFNSDLTFSGVTLTSPYTSAQLARLDWAQSDSTLWLFHPDVPVQRLQRLGTGTWIIAAAPFTQQPFDETGFVPAVAGTLSAATVGTGRTLTTPSATFLTTDVGRGVIFDAGLAVITAWSSTTSVTVEITRAFPSVTLPANAWRVDVSPQTSCTPSAKDPVGASITLTLAAAGWRNTDVGSIVRINGGLCRITGYSADTVVNATILREMSGIVASPALAWSLEPPVWSAANGYPRTGTIYQQRLIVAGSAKYPRTVWGSRSGELLDFERWTNDADSFSFTIDSDDATAITYLTATQELAALTESGEYSIRGGVEKPITPTNVRIKLESNHGTAQVRPVQIANEAMFVQRAGRKVRSFGYRYDFDAFRAPDVIALAEHLSTSGITWMTYAQEPEQMLWATRTDGKFISCTIDRDQQPSVIGWALHDTAGAVECVASIPFGDREQVWAIVRRTINGAVVRYLEALDDTLEAWHPSDPDPANGQPRPVYGCTVDAGIVFDNPAGATSFSVPHLAGMEVDIVADGSKMPRQTVGGAGALTLPRAGRRVIIGLPFRSFGTLLTPEFQGAMGSAQGTPARSGELFVRFLDTVGGKVQNNQGNEQVIPVRRLGDPTDQPVLPFTGAYDIGPLLGWERGDSEISIIQDDPLPQHVLAVIRTHVGGA